MWLCWITFDVQAWVNKPQLDQGTVSLNDSNFAEEVRSYEYAYFAVQF